MLKEIWSPAFLAHGKQRPPITFHKGFNVILGEENGHNSIGKSSALLAIDFVFGGNAYLKSDGVEQIGHHPIYSCFQFGTREYRFMRDTRSSKQVSICTKEYRLTGEVWEADQFTDWLKKQYAIDYPGLSFRETISSFFRIYGKGNATETNPPQGISGRGMEISLQTVIKLFNYFGEIESLSEQKKKHADQISVFKKAQEYRFLPGDVTNKTLEIENEMRIKELKAKREQMIASEEQSTDPDISKSQQQNALKTAIEELDRKIAEAQRRQRLVQTSLDYKLFPTQADLDALMNFFPDVELEPIYQVEAFHKKIAGILEQDFQEEHEQLQINLEEYQTQRSRLELELAQLGPVRKYSREFLNAHSTISAEITRLEKQNEIFAQYKELEEIKKDIEKSYNKLIFESLKSIERRLNQTMRQLNNEILGPGRSAPVLTINAANSYSFKTPRDTGTGTNYRGLIFYDIAMMKETALPALAHDSFLFKNVDDRSIEGILKEYAAATNRQVFISFDRAGTYNETVQQLIYGNTVLSVSSGGNELYGKAWNEEEPS